MIDFTFSEHGSICLLRPNNDAADAWMREHLAIEQAQFFGSAIAIEARYAGDILTGLTNDGLTVERA
jgi:hypothetical protein